MWGTYTQVATKAFGFRTGERFCEDVSRVIGRSDADNFEFFAINEVPGGVVLDAEVSHFGVPALIFSKLA
jgi:hypothetical protein